MLDALATYYAQNYAGIIGWSLDIIFRLVYYLAMIVFVHEDPLLRTITSRVNKLTLK